MTRSSLLSFALFASFAGLATGAHAQTRLAAGSERYTIVEGSAQGPAAQNAKQAKGVQPGQTLGQAQYAVTPVAGGFTLTSSGQMTLAKFSYSYRAQATIDSQMNLVRHELTGSVNGAKAHGNDIRFNTAADSTGKEFQINISADGKQSTNSVDRHRNTVLVPDLDPAAYMLMARIALSQPQTAWVLIPKETGVLVPAEYELRADLRGTINGADVTVKHSTAVLSAQNAVTVELFYTGEGTLLEADLNAQNIYVVHDGFKLLEHPAPTPPPAGEVPTQNGQPGAAQQPGQQPQAGQQYPQ